MDFRPCFPSQVAQLAFASLLEVSLTEEEKQARLRELKVLTVPELWGDCSCLRCERNGVFLEGPSCRHGHSFYRWDEEYDLCATCFRVARVSDFEIQDEESNERFNRYWQGWWAG